MANKDAKQERNAYRSDSIEFRPGDRAVTRIGRNLVEVRVKAKTVGGWTVTTRTGRDITARSLEPVPGAAAAATAQTAEPAKAAPAKAAPAKAASGKAASGKAAPAKAKPTPAPSARAVPQKGLSLLNAAAAVLERSDAPMAVKAMIEGAKDSGLWSPGGGKTPEQTLYSAIIREIRDKGEAARFRKEGRGLFAFVR